jgi:MoxR-like ATPase
LKPDNAASKPADGQDDRDVEAQLAKFRAAFSAAQAQLHQVIVGQESVVDYVLMAVFLQGHVLLEGVPGLGKTLLMTTLGDVLGLDVARVQFTPDLMPADIIGTRVLQQDDKGHVRFDFEQGPVFTRILLADEINRATPKTQSALLQAMQERQVTVAGVTYKLPEPFMVMATQNPLESEGTYPLPEAQLDRFLFKLIVRFPTQIELMEIMRRTTQRLVAKADRTVESAQQILEWGGLLRQVPIATPILEYAARILLGTHRQEKGPNFQAVGKYVRFGASPRGLQAMVLAAKVRAVLDGRFAVSRDDIAKVAKPCLRHRILLTFEAESEGIQSDNLVDLIIQNIN